MVGKDGPIEVFALSVGRIQCKDAQQQFAGEVIREMVVKPPLVHTSSLISVKIRGNPE
jgi:hypothetical protein